MNLETGQREAKLLDGSKATTPKINVDDKKRMFSKELEDALRNLNDDGNTIPQEADQLTDEEKKIKSVKNL
jgi:hypothetical protein